MEAISTLVGQIITILCVAALLEQLIPSGSATLGYVRTFTGLFILISLLNPLTLSFNLWEHSLSQLAGQSLRAQGQSINNYQVPQAIKPLEQRIRLPQKITEALPVKAGSKVIGVELLLEDQRLKGVSVEIHYTAGVIAETAAWSLLEQEELQRTLSETLGVKLEADQIQWIFR